MKTFLMILSLLISSASFSQRPLLVDNSQYFPPYRSQQNLGNCTHFALIYYLKSAIWNKEFNRDPNLEENQFSHSFVWNQNIFPETSHSGTMFAATFLQNQGCASVKDFPLDEASSEKKPSAEVREKALSYKTKKINSIYFTTGGKEDIKKASTEFINSLKDSLIKGNNFTFDFVIYPYFFDLEADNNIYHWYNKTNRDSMSILHQVAIVGYNDTIKTAQGKGAFIAVNSHSKLPLFYFDYNWFYENNFVTSAFFLEEDFSSKPEIALHISLENSLANTETYSKDFMFIERVAEKEGRVVDFVDYFDYLYRTNIVQVVSVNGEKIGSESKVMLPINSPDGDYDIVADLTELLQGEEFESVELIVFDPIAGEFVGVSDEVIYSYERESKLKISSSYLSLIGTNFKALAEVMDLADTTYVFEGVRSLQAKTLVPYNPSDEETNTYGAQLKKSTSVLARKLIKISREDLRINTAPEFVNAIDTVEVYQDSIFTYQYKALDSENDSLSFSISGFLFSVLTVGGDFIYYEEMENPGVSINENGLISYTGKIPEDWYGDYAFNYIVEVKDDIFSIKDTVNVKVFPRINQFPEFSPEPDSIYHCYLDSTYFIDFLVYDPEKHQVTVEVGDFSGGEAGIITFHDNEFKRSLYFSAEKIGSYTITVYYSDGYHFLEKNINIEVTPYTNIKDRHKANFALVAYPNPVQDNVHFEFNLPQRGMITLEVYDLTGKLIETAVSDYFESGYNRATFNGSYLSPGTYLCRLRDENNTVQTIKIIKR